MKKIKLLLSVLITSSTLFASTLSIKNNIHNSISVDNKELSISKRDNIQAFNTINELRANSVINANYLALVKGYYKANDGGGGQFIWLPNDTSADNGGTIIKANSTAIGRWHRLMTDTRVNVKWFGARPDGAAHIEFQDPIILPNQSGYTDNQPMFQKAINYCAKKGYELYVPAGEEYVNTAENNSISNKAYIVNSTIEIKKTINIIGQPLTKIIGNTNNSIISIEGNFRGQIKDIYFVGYKYKPKSGIELKHKSGSNNQGMELDNVKVTDCKYGVYSQHVSSFNRGVMRRCEFTSNIKAGVWFEGKLIAGDLNTTPIQFINTTINGNGWHDWMKDYPNLGIDSVSLPPPYYQLYIKTANNITFVGGQISNHFKAFNNALVYLQDGIGANFQGVDFEGGPANHFENAGVYLKNFKGFNCTQSHIYAINTKKVNSNHDAVFVFEGDCEYASIKNIDFNNDEHRELGDFTNSVNVIESNYNTNNRVFLEYDGPTHKLSVNALNSFNKSNMEVLTNINGPIKPSIELNKVFTKIPNNNGVKYDIHYKEEETLYIEKELVGATVLYVVIESTQISFEPHGRFFVRQFPTLKQPTDFTEIHTKAIYNLDGKYYTFLKVLINDKTKKVRYGFKNSQNYIGKIPDHATVKGITVYADYKHPLLKRQLTRKDH